MFPEHQHAGARFYPSPDPTDSQGIRYEIQKPQIFELPQPKNEIGLRYWEYEVPCYSVNQAYRPDRETLPISQTSFPDRHNMKFRWIQVYSKKWISCKVCYDKAGQRAWHDSFNDPLQSDNEKHCEILANIIQDGGYYLWVTWLTWAQVGDSGQLLPIGADPPRPDPVVTNEGTGNLRSGSPRMPGSNHPATVGKIPNDPDETKELMKAINSLLDDND